MNNITIFLFDIHLLHNTERTELNYGLDNWSIWLKSLYKVNVWSDRKEEIVGRSYNNNM